jgi:hypothetical protein
MTCSTRIPVIAATVPKAILAKVVQQRSKGILCFRSAGISASLANHFNHNKDHENISVFYWHLFVPGDGFDGTE